LLKGRMSRSSWAWLLSVLIGARACCAPLVFYAVVADLRLLAICVFGVACMTDLLDGQIAKSTLVSPPLGAYADPTADFLLILGAFSSFVVMGLYPVWTVALIGVMFLQFVVTSGLDRPVYDPVGKYYGAVLFGAVGITLVSANPAIRQAVLIGVVLYTLASAASRTLLLLRRRKMTDPRR
jgi:CDP-diacylglycerol--glycerol-3-phosphate 3-phosphatidyltransferase